MVWYFIDVYSRWLDWIFLAGLPQLYYIKMKIYDLHFIAIGVAMAT